MNYIFIFYEENEFIVPAYHGNLFARGYSILYRIIYITSHKPYLLLTVMSV